MRSLGVKNYRLSVSWPRIYPQGDGAVNQKGLDFYSRLIDELIANDITPWVTLFSLGFTPGFGGSGRMAFAHRHGGVWSPMRMRWCVRWATG